MASDYWTHEHFMSHCLRLKAFSFFPYHQSLFACISVRVETIFSVILENLFRFALIFEQYIKHVRSSVSDCHSASESIRFSSDSNLSSVSFQLSGRSSDCFDHSESFVCQRFTTFRRYRVVLILTHSLPLNIRDSVAVSCASLQSWSEALTSALDKN
jgi:hypothetical protein